MRWKRATEEQLQQGVSAKKINGHDGFWYEQPDMWKKYLRRPDKLKDMCCAQFVKMYKGFNPKEEGENNEDMEDVFEEDFELCNDENDDMKFNFIRTIVMSKSNPMNVRNYTYKVEFQGRGKSLNIFNNFHS